MLVSMNIAIIGTCGVAYSYAEELALAGHNVFLACREQDSIVVSDFLAMLESVTVCSIEAAACVADIIIVATEPKDVREVAYWLGDVRNKVIIDVTSNVQTPDDDLVKTICGLRSITGSQHIVKAFSTKGYEQVLSPLFHDRHVDMMLVGESKKAKEMTKILAQDLDMTSFYDFGGNEAIELFNGMTTCWRNLLAQNTAANKDVLPVKG